jgi:hypothetical protein
MEVESKIRIQIEWSRWSRDRPADLRLWWRLVCSNELKEVIQNKKV